MWWSIQHPTKHMSWFPHLHFFKNTIWFTSMIDIICFATISRGIHHQIITKYHRNPGLGHFAHHFSKIKEKTSFREILRGKERFSDLLWDLLDIDGFFWQNLQFKFIEFLQIFFIMRENRKHLLETIMLWILLDQFTRYI